MSDIHCCPVRDGQNTDSVPPGITLIGSELRQTASGNWSFSLRYQCDGCGAYWLDLDIPGIDACLWHRDVNYPPKKWWQRKRRT